jgi:fructose transport system substrate-binding protein
MRFTSANHSGRSKTRRIRSIAVLASAAVMALVVVGCSATPSADAPIKVSLIGVDITNPYYLKMTNDTKAEAKKLGVDLSVQTGTSATGADTVTGQIEQAVAGGAKAILIQPGAGPAINPAIKKARAAGVLVLAVDNPTTPASTVDMAYVTGNLSVAKQLGAGTAASLGGKKAVVAMLDVFEGQVIQVDVDRDQGFLTGMGINLVNPDVNADEAKTGSYTGGKGGKYEIVCNQATKATQDGGRTAMENCLSANPDINVVYTINEPAAFGAFEALKAAGKTSGVIVATFDGSCDGIAAMKKGEVTLDAQTYPGKQGSLALAAAVAYIKDKTKPAPSDGLDYFNTGSALVSADSISGVDTITPDAAAKLCF